MSSSPSKASEVKETQRSKVLQNIQKQGAVAPEDGGKALNCKRQEAIEENAPSISSRAGETR
jgi:hypothetical protein